MPIIHLSLIPSIETKDPQFFGHNNSILGGVTYIAQTTKIQGRREVLIRRGQ